jgi:hypothetical protein
MNEEDLTQCQIERQPVGKSLETLFAPLLRRAPVPGQKVEQSIPELSAAPRPFS